MRFAFATKPQLMPPTIASKYAAQLYLARTSRKLTATELKESSAEQNEQRILILAPTGRDADLTASFLQQAALHAETCRDMDDVVERCEQGCGAILLAEEALSAASAQTLIDLIAHQPSWSDIPILIITSTGNANANTQHRLALMGPTGNVIVLERPFRPQTLINAVQVALRSRMRQYQVRALLQAQAVQNEKLSASEREYRELSESLEQMVTERTASLLETNKHLEAFCYTISHDLRAPLRAQQGFSELLLEEYGDVLGETGRDYAVRISNAAQRLDRLVNDLLAYSRISRTEIVPVPIDLRTTVLRVKNDMDLEIRNAKATVQIAEFSYCVAAHDTVLQIVINNLLSNAVKFARPGVTPQIKIRAEQRERFIRLWVEDNGIGIAPNHHDHIFGVFHRLHLNDQYPGTGVGLAIVAKAVERMNGRVGLESREGEGSRFWIELQAC